MKKNSSFRWLLLRRGALSVLALVVGLAVSMNAQTPRRATALATVVNGFVVSITVTDGGAGYLIVPTVNIYGGTGAGATAVATITNGTVAEVIVLTAGRGYTNSPNVVISEPETAPAPPSGLVAWWPGDGNGNDFRDTNNAMLNNITFAPGKVGQAFTFNGTNADIKVPAARVLDVGQGSGFTMEMWLNAYDMGPHPLFEWKNSNALGLQMWISGIYAIDGNFGANLIGPNGIQHQIWTGPAAVVPGTWQHVALTYDRSIGTATIYVDGNIVSTKQFGNFTLNTADDLYFGVRPVGPYAGTRFKGLIDEPSLYNRALSAAEIQAIYRAGGAGKDKAPLIVVKPESQVAFWGKSVTFSVKTAGPEPVTYQWLKGAEEIPGAVAAILTLNNLEFDDAGSYSVKLSNQFGGVISKPVTLTINPAGVSIALYPGITIDSVAGKTFSIQYSTDLNLSNNWITLTNITLSEPILLWYDKTPVSSQSQRFYQVVPRP